MNYIFGITSCWKMKAKNKNFQSKIGQNLKILGIWELYYLKRKLRTCTIQIQKEKVWFCAKEQLFLNFFDFYSKGGPLDVKIVKNIFLIFQKFQKKNSTNDFHGTIQTWKWCRNAKAFHGYPGHNGPPCSK